MVGRKITYLLLVAVTAYIGLMYEGPVPGVLLAFELLLFVFLFLLSWVLSRSVSVSIESADGVAESMERSRIMLVFHNKGWLPVSDAMLRVTVSNCLEEEYEEYEINLRGMAKSRVRFPFSFTSSYCGVVQAVFTELDVFDYLRLFKRRRKMNAVSECVIMPKLHDMQLAITEACRNFDSDSDEFDKNKSGDDPSEIFRLREFRQGDKLSRVHWKISARLDTTMVKELSLPVSNSIGIYLDLRFGSIEEAQSVFELCYSLSMALLAQECHHRLYWCKSTEPFRFEEFYIRNPEDLTEGMGRLLTTGRRTEHLYWEEFRNAHPQLAIYRMIGITCMDPSRDMEEFNAPDQMIKSVLTVDSMNELIEI